MGERLLSYFFTFGIGFKFDTDHVQQMCRDIVGIRRNICIQNGECFFNSIYSVTPVQNNVISCNNVRQTGAIVVTFQPPYCPDCARVILNFVSDCS